jgi:hypothetical protein
VIPLTAQETKRGRLRMGVRQAVGAQLADFIDGLSFVDRVVLPIFVAVAVFILMNLR